MKATQHDIPLSFEANGSGPSILFIHDRPDNQSISEPRFVALVNAGFRVILTNLRGLTATGEVTVDDLTDDTVSLLNYLGIGRAVMFGIGRGSCVLLSLLEKHPERIAGASLVIPPAMESKLRRFAGRKGVIKRLRRESAAPLIQELFNAVPTSLSETVPLSELPGLRPWIDQTATLPQDKGKAGLALLGDLNLPLLLIDTPVPPCGRLWRQRLGSRLKSFNRNFLALLDLLVPEESDNFDEDALGESH